jgi:tetratricopeptide (TPR) repeat protein
VGRGPAWVTAGLVQTPVHVTVPLGEGCVRALAEVAQVQDDGDMGDRATLLAGECLYVLHNHALAAEGLKKLVQRDPDNSEAQKWLSQIFILLDNSAEAKEPLRAWGRLDPKNGVPYRWLGFFEKEDKRDAALAVAAYREALRRNLSEPMKADVVEELAAVLKSMFDYETALEVLEQCPEPFQDRPTILSLKAECLSYRPGGQDKAISLMDDALRRDPGNREALFRRASLYLVQGQPRAALPLFEKAAAIDPYDLKGQQYLRETCSKLKSEATAPQEKQAYEAQIQHTLALEEQTKATMRQLSGMQKESQQRPGDVAIRYEIAMKALTINRYREARMWLEAALAINPNHRRAAAALSQLAAITSFEPRLSARQLQ